MTRRRVTDEQYAALDRRLDEVKRRADEGSLSFKAVMDDLQTIIEGKSLPTERPAEKTGVLKEVDTITVGPLTTSFEPRKFFKTRKGLWVSDGFADRMFPDAAVAEPTGAVQLKCFDLVKTAYDHEIKTELPQKHDVQLWQIAKLIEAQESGKSGPLLTNGYWNIFYIGGFAVDVRWNGDGRRWFVGAWRLGHVWDADGRVFSSNDA